MAKYSALPYVMRYEKCYTSPYAGMYSVLGGWCNQPDMFKKFSFRMFAICRGMKNKTTKNTKEIIRVISQTVGKKYSSWRYMEEFEKEINSG